MLRSRTRFLVPTKWLVIVLCATLLATVASAANTQVASAARFPLDRTTTLSLFNPASHGARFQWVVRMNVLDAARATKNRPAHLLNELVVSSTCGDCRTVGVAIQINLVGPGTAVQTGSHSVSRNHCLYGGCLTMGLAIQYTIMASDLTSALPKVRDLVQQVIAQMHTMFPNHQVDKQNVLSSFNDIVQLLVPEPSAVSLATPSRSTTVGTPASAPSLSVAISY